MTILTSDWGLLAWTLFSLLSLVLMVVAVIQLINNNWLPMQAKVFWILVILFVPFIGSTCYFVFCNRANRIKNVSGKA